MNKSVVLFVIIIGLLGSILVVVQSSKKEAVSISRTVDQTGESSGEVKSAFQAKTYTNYSDGISLTLTKPQNNSTVTTPTIIVAGKTAPRADVFINDVELKADNTGKFSTNLILDEGENPIVIFANDAEGNSAEKEITITYDPQ